MKQQILAFCCAALALASCNNESKQTKTASADTAVLNPVSEEKKDKAWIPIDSAMMEKAWRESMTLGEQHKMLAKASGNWNGDITMWMADGAPPMQSKATTVNTMLYGGLYQQSKHTGTMMGAPFEGMSLMGYDNMKKEFVSTWIDNMGSGILMMTGNWDEAAKKITMTGTMKNPANGLDCDIRETFTMMDDDHQLLEMYGPDPKTGKQFKNMEIKYTRRK